MSFDANIPQRDLTRQERGSASPSRQERVGGGVGAFSAPADGRAGGAGLPRSRKLWDLSDGIAVLKEGLRPLSTSKARFFCGVTPIPEASEVILFRRRSQQGRAKDGTVDTPCLEDLGVGGLVPSTSTVAPAVWAGNTMTCKDRLCPSCAMAKMRDDGDELERVVELWGGLALVRQGRLAVKHVKSDSLLELHKGQVRAYQHMRDSRAFRRLEAHYGFEVVISLHVNRGGYAGWNRHSHPCFFFPRPITEAEEQDVRETISELWCRSVERTMGARFVPRDREGVSHGFHLGPMNEARYVANWAMELSSNVTKEAKGRGHLSMWDVAARAADGNRGYRALWLELQTAMKGAHWLDWPKARESRLRKLRDLVREEIERERREEERTSEPVAAISRPIWDVLKWARFKGGHFVRVEILDCVQGGGGEVEVYEIITDYLNARGHRAAGDLSDDLLAEARAKWREVVRQRRQARATGPHDALWDHRPLR